MSKLVTWGTITWNVGNYGDIQGKCDECGTLNIPYPAVTQGSKCRLTQTLNRNVNLLPLQFSELWRALGMSLAD